MKINIVQIFKNVLNNSQTGKCQIFQITRRAQNYVKPFTKINHYSSVASMFKHDIHLFSIKLSQYSTTKFSHVYQSARPIDLKAYSISAPHYGIAGFVEDIETDTIPYYTVPWNRLQTQNNNGNKIDLEKNELSSIYVLLKLYAKKFHGKRVQIYCDNVSVICMLTECETSLIKQDLKQIINAIKSICSENKIDPCWSRIIGVQQIAADRLTRGIDDPFQYSSFKPQSAPDSMGLENINLIIKSSKLLSY